MRIINYIYIVLAFFMTINQTFGQQIPKAIAHALGSIDGHVYTNSREAMIHSIEKGYKFIEVDIDTTSDGVFIASHDWEYFNRITNHSELKDSMCSFEQFSKRKIYDKYTPITIREIIDTLINHPDISIVTDKTSDPVIIDDLFSEIKERVYIECFTKEDYIELKKKGYHTMFSSYTTENTLVHVITNLLRGNGRIDFITTSTYQDFKNIKALRCVMPLQVAMYTIDSKEFLDEHIDEIEFFYSDFYDPSTDTFIKSEK